MEFGAHGVTADELRAEITRLRRQVAYMLLDHQNCGPDCRFCNTEKLEAEIDRLREALERARPYVSGYKVGSERNLKWLDEALRELPLGGEAGMKTTHNGTKHQHLGAGADNSEQGGGER